MDSTLEETSANSRPTLPTKNGRAASSHGSVTSHKAAFRRRAESPSDIFRTQRDLAYLDQVRAEAAFWDKAGTLVDDERSKRGRTELRGLDRRSRESEARHEDARRGVGEPELGEARFGLGARHEAHDVFAGDVAHVDVPSAIARHA